MKPSFILSLALAASLVSVHAQQPAAPATGLKDPKARLSYSIGSDIGSSIKTNVEGADLESLLAGIRDSFTGANPQMTPDEQKAELAAFQKVMMQKQMEKMMAAKKESGGKAKQEGEAFLAANKSKEGVKTLPSGLQYKVISE